MDHAMAEQIFFFGPEQMIRRFVKDPSFDQLICGGNRKTQVTLSWKV